MKLHRIGQSSGWTFHVARTFLPVPVAPSGTYRLPNATIAAAYRYACSHTCGTSFSER